MDVQNKPLKVLGTANLRLKYGEETIEQDFIVTEGITEDCVLGLDAIYKHEFVLDGQAKEIYLAKDRPGQAYSHQMQATPRRRTTLRPKSTTICCARLKSEFNNQPFKETFYFSPNEELPKGVVLEPFVDECSSNNRLWVSITNTNPQPLVLKRKQPLGTLDFSIAKVACVTANHNYDAAPLYINSITTNQANSQPCNLESVLEEFQDLFVNSDAELGHATAIKHHINTEGRGPIRLRPYRSSNKQQEEIKKQTDKMLQQNVIRPSDSPWAAPVVLVEKKNGDMRFCIDYRKLNSVTKKNSFPMPRIDDTLDMLHGKKFFSTLDLAAGYWQIELDEESKEKTAFITGQGLFEFIRMPFGLCNAPATFQRLMNHVLRDLIGIRVLVYLDDIIIFSNSLEEHLTHLREVLLRLRNAGLKLKSDKCDFMREKVNYLGHIISGKGIQPDPKTVEKVVNFRIPSNVDEVRSFLGLAGYYRRFVKNFGASAKPLTTLLSKGIETFKWEQAQQEAFDTLKKALVTPPILAYPDFEQEVTLFTDASDYGIGAVLSQVQNGKEVVIAYASRQLTKPETKYATVEKEALAVVFGTRQFKHYLGDRKFTIISDHRPLQWLQNIKDAAGRLGRWSLQLSNLNYEIQYLPGRVHQNADCLSRARIASVAIMEQPLITFQSQGKDELCRKIMNYLTKGELDTEDQRIPPMWLLDIEKYQIYEGLLFRHGTCASKGRRNTTVAQLVLPKTLKSLVLEKLHSDTTAGHLAFMRTYNKIRQHYYWPNMRKEIEAFCKTCHVCQKNYRPKFRAVLHPHELAKAPFEVIGIDFLGPIKPVSPQGNSVIMVITDYFSKWVEAIPLPNQTALTTAKALCKHVVLRHGLPKAMVTDRGVNFTSKLFRHICKEFNIDHRLTTAYNPASNGETERFNRTLTTMLRKELVEKSHDNWEEVLEYLCFAYRTTVHNSTNETPFFLLHGRDPTLPINQILSATPKYATSYDHVSTVMERLSHSFRKAAETNTVAKERQKVEYNKRAKEHDYKIGDRVLLDIRKVQPGENRKFTSFYKGPYRVLKTHSDSTVEIVDSTYKAQRVHVNRLRPLLETVLFDESKSLGNTVEEEQLTITRVDQKDVKPAQTHSQPSTGYKSTQQHYNLRSRDTLKAPQRLGY